MTTRSRTLATLLAVAACNGNPTGPAYRPDLPTAWATSVTNTYFPLTPGVILQYAGRTPQGMETTTVEVLPGTRVVNSVAATAVLDRVYLDGSLVEETEDWYAEDADGNVWYLGEDSREILDGQVISTEGSWEWGVDGALPGVYMWADPTAHLGQPYRQEFYRGVAEDWGRVMGTSETVTVAGGSFAGCIRTADWTGLGPGLEYKTYCPQVGLVLEVSAGTGARVELTAQQGP